MRLRSGGIMVNEGTGSIQFSCSRATDVFLFFFVPSFHHRLACTHMATPTITTDLATAPDGVVATATAPAAEPLEITYDDPATGATVVQIVERPRRMRPDYTLCLRLDARHFHAALRCLLGRRVRADAEEADPVERRARSLAESVAQYQVFFFFVPVSWSRS